MAEQELIVKKRPKTGGRKKGSKNKVKLPPAKVKAIKESDLWAAIRSGLKAQGLSTSYNPLVSMVIYAESEEGKKNPTLAMACHKEVAQYLYPKKRSVEVSASKGEGVTFLITK